MNLWQQDWISKWALYSPNKIAIQEHESGKEITYKSLNDCANGIAQYLNSEYNIVKGDRVAVLAEYDIEYVALFSASQKAGFIIVPINYRLAQAEVIDIIRDASPKLILTQNKYDHLVSQDFANINQDYNVLNTIGGTEINTITQVEDNDPIFIIYTSGTTGKPKGVKYTHKMLFWNSINTALSLKLNAESRTVNVMPPFHTGGWNVLLTPFLHHGGFVSMCNKFEAENVLQTIASLRCNIFMGVPTMLGMMANEKSFESSDLSCLDYIIVGGESMPIPLIERYATKGVAIRQGYGMTEVGPNLTSLHQDDAINKKGSIGRPNFYVQHRIINENGHDCQANEAGELWLRGPMVTPGYWHNDMATKDAFSTDGEWFKTGDIVIEDEDKYLYIVDRLKNMFISGAENVYPAEIEKVLRQLSDIQECAVIGVKDEKWGEVGKAFIVKSADSLMSDEEIRGFCISKLAKYKVPKYITFIATLPKTDSGKIDRKLLKFL
ncbi:MAG: AMP-binding protein [Saprospiraceae bacterium]|nr:AMP-binding protein [Saprospiraceae bacterium]